uniref:NR LBD domain-containing protein n=1 Tax=Panagrellus redivivus TaxID=6233 RepID=A0A7E4VS40_PANRE
MNGTKSIYFSPKAFTISCVFIDMRLHVINLSVNGKPQLSGRNFNGPNDKLKIVQQHVKLAADAYRAFLKLKSEDAITQSEICIIGYFIELEAFEFVNDNVHTVSGMDPLNESQ